MVYKYRDRRIRDFLERNARDPIRKLGPNDRLVGPARLVLEYGGEPTNLSTVIAAALFYDNALDPIAQKLKKRREDEGIDSVLADVCKICVPTNLKRKDAMSEYSHRERVLLALNHEEPDRIPLDMMGNATMLFDRTYINLRDHLGLSAIPPVRSGTTIGRCRS